MLPWGGGYGNGLDLMAEREKGDEGAKVVIAVVLFGGRHCGGRWVARVTDAADTNKKPKTKP